MVKNGKNKKSHKYHDFNTQRAVVRLLSVGLLIKGSFGHIFYGTLSVKQATKALKEKKEKIYNGFKRVKSRSMKV